MNRKFMRGKSVSADFKIPQLIHAEALLEHGHQESDSL